MNKHDLNISLGKIQIKMKLIENALIENEPDKALNHLKRIKELLNQLQVQTKDIASCN